MTGADRSNINIRRDGSIIRVVLDDNNLLHDIAKLDSVGSVEEVHELGLCNNVARQILHADVDLGLSNDVS